MASTLSFRLDHWIPNYSSSLDKEEITMVKESLIFTASVVGISKPLILEIRPSRAADMYILGSFFKSNIISVRVDDRDEQS